MQGEAETGAHTRRTKMIAIQKGQEPEGLESLRRQAAEEGLSPKKAYALLKNPLKKQVRNRLIEEQGRLCAYCMCRIPRSDVDPVITPIIMEHMIPRNTEDGRDVGQALDYHNLVAVCHGNQGPHGTKTILDLTCDAHKANDEFRKVNPCRPDTLESIEYTMDGKIDAADPDVRFDLIHTLNLNCPTSPLVAERKAALDHLIDAIGSVPEEEQAEYCAAVLNDFYAETDSKTCYVGVLIWYLKSILSAMNDAAV